MRFVESVAITFISRIIIVFVSVASSIIAARWLGPAGKGTLAVLWVIVGLGLQFGNFGFHASNVYFTSRNKKTVSNVASNSLCFGLIAGITISSGIIGVYLIKPGLFGNIPFLLVLVTIILIPFKLILYFFQHLFLGLKKVLTYNSFELAERISLLAIVVVVLVLLKERLFMLMLSISIISGVLTIFFIIYTKRVTNFNFFTFNTNLLKRMLGYGIKPYLANFFSFLLIRSDMILVNYFKGANSSGIYSIAVNFADLLYLLPITIGGILFPKISGNVNDDGTFTQKVSRHTVFLMGIICLLTALICKPLILLMYGKQFVFSVSPFLWLLPGIFFLSLVTIYNSDLAGRGYPPFIILASAIGFILNFSLNLFFIPQWGEIGAAITSSISYFVMFMIMLIYLIRFRHTTFKSLLFPSFSEIWNLFKYRRTLRKYLE
ncbi:MAG: polysaccharide biosynthesis C-terminal domain-containing protein [bacterium]